MGSLVFMVMCINYGKWERSAKFWSFWYLVEVPASARISRLSEGVSAAPTDKTTSCTIPSPLPVAVRAALQALPTP